jgi:hypothetical protein
MSEGFDPLGIVAGLVAHGVSYVLVGELAAEVQGAPMEADRVEICLPGDQENLARLALALEQLGARQRTTESDDDNRASFDSQMGRFDCIESTTEFESLSASASNINLGRGVVARVASLDDLARSKKASADLSGAARLAAFVDVSEEPGEELKVRVEADAPRNSRVDRLLEKLGSVDVFLSEVNSGQRPLRRKKV